MAKRSEDWNIGLAKDLRDSTFAREFLLASNRGGMDLQVALAKVIRAMGVKEFAAPGADHAQISTDRRVSGATVPPKDRAHARVQGT